MSKHSQIISTVEVGVPVRVAYDQWTQFAEFPKFMQGVDSVQQIDDTTLMWDVDIGDERRQWIAKITEQIPDNRIAWKSVSGAPNEGGVTFQRIDDNRCRVTLQLDYEVQGAVERIGDVLGIVEQRVRGDMDRFKLFIEDRKRPTNTKHKTNEAPQTHEERSASSSR